MSDGLPHSPKSFANAWKNSSHLLRWLEQELDEHWPEKRPDETRTDWDGEGRWIWIVPDFVNGRSRIIGVDRELLEQENASKHIQQTLQELDWLERMDLEDILVSRDEQGRLYVVTWRPEIEEQWFPDPKGGYFVAYETTAHAVSAAGPPSVNPEPFLALDGATWAAVGPAQPRSPKSYTFDELQGYLPGAAR